MTLDRNSIERKDFPMAKRGYDPAAVDAHLGALASEIDELDRGARHPQPETLATSVSKQVRAIVEAAENSAAEILKGAELEAQEIRAQASQAVEQASGEAQRKRETAAAQARAYVGRLSNSISQLLGRLEEMDGELNALTASLRNDTERLRGQLGGLDVELEGAVAGSESAPEAAEVTPQTAQAAEVSDFPERRAAPVATPRTAPVAAPRTAPVAAPVATPEPAPGAKLGDEPPEDAPAAGDSADSEGARLVALNMALNGTPREETERYLAENYDLADTGRLLDEVYASVQN